MERAYESLVSEIEKIPVIDAHSHIDPRRPSARDLDDILADRCLRDLILAAGLDPELLRSDVPPEERARASGRLLAAIENTAAYRWFDELARTLFGFSGRRVRPAEFRDLWAAAERTLNQENWEENLFHRSRIEKIFLTNDFDDSLEGFDAARYVPCLRADDLVFGLSEPATVERMRQAGATDVGNAASLREAFGAILAKFAARGAKACAVALPPDFAPVRVSEGSADPKLRRLLAGEEATQAEAAEVSAFAFWTFLELCSDRRLPLHVFAGVEREGIGGPRRGGLRRWNRPPSLYGYRDLFREFPGIPFAVSTPFGDANGELIAMSCAFPNLTPCGHWWYSEAPALLERDLRARLQSVPRTKQIGYFSDAGTLEFVAPKFAGYRRLLARVLAADFVVERGWTEDRALELARDLLRGNAARLFFGAEPREDGGQRP